MALRLAQVASAEEAYAEAAAVLRAALHTAWDEGRPAQVVLSGGRSGAALAARLAELLLAPDAGPAHLWIADERFVPAADPDRNDTPIIEALGPARDRIVVHRHAQPAEGSIEAAASALADELRIVLAGAPFDAVLLSMGEDGHVASVFPGHAQPSAIAYTVLDSPKPPSLRTTISLPRLAATGHCAVLALGAAKAEAIRAALAHDVRLPVVQLAATRAVVLITDVP